MRLARRQVLQFAAAAAALPIASRIAGAQAYPVRPLRIVIGFAPGGVGDILARLIGQHLQERLGQSVVVESIPGAGGNLGAEAVAKSAPDGYTLYLAGANNAINPSLYPNLKADLFRELVVVATFMRVPLIVVVHPSVPVKTIAELIDHAKANPANVNMASSGVGTSPHLSGELMKMMTGISMVHIPYRSEGPALADLVAGQVQVMFANPPASIGHVREGRLRALAVTSATRWPGLPDIAPVADAVPGYDVTGWFGIAAPRATPSDIVARLNKEINASLADPKLVARLGDFGATPLILSPAEADAFVAGETEKWAKVVKFSGVKIN
jgi:tripartite-type tricarboxylate transporter receptor subunit TctC